MDEGLSPADCEAQALACQLNGDYRRAAEYWRLAAELCWSSLLKAEYDANAEQCDAYDRATA